MNKIIATAIALAFSTSVLAQAPKAAPAAPAKAEPAKAAPATPAAPAKAEAKKAGKKKAPGKRPMVKGKGKAKGK